MSKDNIVDRETVKRILTQDNIPKNARKSPASNNKELKPCPFCGCKKITLTVHHINPTEYAYCDQCGVMILKEFWNTRPESAWDMANRLLEIIYKLPLEKQEYYICKFPYAKKYKEQEAKEIMKEIKKELNKCLKN